MSYFYYCLNKKMMLEKKNIVNRMPVYWLFYNFGKKCYTHNIQHNEKINIVNSTSGINITLLGTS